jgi:Na+/proline symporter
VHYQDNPFTDMELATVNNQTTVENVAELRADAKYAVNVETGENSNVIIPGKPDYVFPMWIVTALPVGLSGLILAGVFAAAISSLDSILAALSQTTLSMIYHPERGEVKLTERQLLLRSRLLVIAWGVVLTLFTFLLVLIHEGIPILSLAFGMTSYTVGPILAIFLAAMLGRGGVRGLVIGTVLSMILVLFVRTDVWTLFIYASLIEPETLAKLPTYDLVGGSLKPVYGYYWMWPITAILTFVCGQVFGGRRSESGADIGTPGA